MKNRKHLGSAGIPAGSWVSPHRQGAASAVPKSGEALGALAPEGRGPANHAHAPSPIGPQPLSFRAESAKRGICFSLEHEPEAL